MKLDYRRQRPLNQHPYQSGPWLYWMSRDQRVEQNWALLHAAANAQTHGVSFGVVFCLSPKFLGATWRQYDFMLQGLAEVEAALAKLHIPFYLLIGEATKVLPVFVKKHGIGGVVCDFSPLKVGRKWRETIAERLSIPVIEVDAHNVVPAWLASDKLEFAARTIRPKLHRLWPTFLTQFPKVPHQPRTKDLPATKKTNWTAVAAKLHLNRVVKPVTWLTPGSAAATIALSQFVSSKLAGYDEHRNDPNRFGQSDLSPYLHFGQLSAQQVALKVQASSAPAKDRAAFLEELLVRRELADNFCLYQPEYDSVTGFPKWGQTTLQKHLRDAREYHYTLAEFEAAQTHDPLWNAAQLEMVRRGKMHGYLRMYWAKKILEWTRTPADALKIAIYLNDTYELDGRDPNGYTGIAWSIGGVHDRPWVERPIFGAIRYMNAAGANRKFNVEAYIEYVNQLSP